MTECSSSYFVDSYHLLSYDEIDSTNEEAKRLALAGGQPGAVIWSAQQTAGKGRNGREWISSEGNLHCSFLLKPCAPVKHLPQLSFVASLALHNAIASLIPSSDMLTIKWPNDLMLNDKKLGGILLETTTDAQDGEHWVIIGMGVNVESAPQIENVNAISLKDTEVEIISAKIVLSRLLTSFDIVYDQWLDSGFEPIRNRWLKHASYLDEEVTLINNNTVTDSGIYQTIDESGCIIIKDAHETRRHAAGDVSLRKSNAT